jgi:hypothetical protein
MHGLKPVPFELVGDLDSNSQFIVARTVVAWIKEHCVCQAKTFLLRREDLEDRAPGYARTCDISRFQENFREKS